MPKFVIPVTYTMYGQYVIEAPTLLDALDTVDDLPLPVPSDYVDNSLEVHEEDVRENNAGLTEGDLEDLSEWVGENYRQRND